MPAKPGLSYAPLTDAPPLTPELARLSEVDPSGLWRRLVDFPDQAALAWRLGSSWTGAVTTTEIRRVVVVGMGGSAIGAQLVARIVEQRSPVAVEVVRDSALPAIDEHTLLVASSFSGETEEVLTAIRSNAAQPGMKMAITRGGTLAELAEELGIPVLRYAYEGEPRSALGYGVLLLLGVLERFGVFAETHAEVIRALEEVRASCVPFRPDAEGGRNPARDLAAALRTSIPVVLADSSLAGAAVRWQNQFNENGKHWAFPGTLPEALHNLVESLHDHEDGAGEPVPPQPFHVVLLEDQSRPSTARARIDAMEELLRDSCIATTRLQFQGGSDLSTLLQACLAGDWVSYYLAVDEGIDPSPVPVISHLKERVAELADDRRRRVRSATRRERPIQEEFAAK